MTTKSAVEQELLEATKVKVSKFKNRQDLLAAIVRAMEKLSDNEFDNLTDAAADWHSKQAVPAMHHKATIPDFPDVETGAAEAEAEDENTDEIDDVAPEDEDDPDEAEAEADEEAGDVDEPEDREASAEEAPKPKKGKLAAKVPEPKSVKPVKAAKPEKVKPSKTIPEVKIDYEAITGDRDRYNVVLGTKAAMAVSMYEKGTTAEDIDKKIGGRHFNILRRLATQGHQVVKEGKVWTLTHKDDIVSKKKGK